MTHFDPLLLRPEFPALGMTQDGEPVIYFDGPGGTQVPSRVIEAVADYYRTMNSNTDGSFLTSRRSDAMLAEAHGAMADFLGSRSANEIKFGQNMTTHTFNLSRAIGATLKPGDEVIVTVLDHEANVSPWQALQEKGAVIRCVDINTGDCTLDMADLDAKLSERTKIVAVGYASNAVGTINPVKEIVQRAHAAGALAFIDAVHYAPHGPIDVQDLDCDFLAVSVYKFFGPHLGALYVREQILERLPSYKVRPAYDTLETGTLNHEGIAGSLAALDYLANVGTLFGGEYVDRLPKGLSGRQRALKLGMSAIKEYEHGLSKRFYDGIQRIADITVWGITDPARFHQRTPTFALTFDALHPRAVAEWLGDRGIFVWDGDFYAQALIERLGLFERGGVVRIGFTHYNTVDEVDQLLTALESVVRQRSASASGLSDVALQR
jgi:cysteine desulfurase family protein (TIGR01976 family)